MRHGACKASMRREANDGGMECQSKGDEVELVALRQVAPRRAAQRQDDTNRFGRFAERGLALSQRDKTHLAVRIAPGNESDQHDHTMPLQFRRELAAAVRTPRKS